MWHEITWEQLKFKNVADLNVRHKLGFQFLIAVLELVLSIQSEAESKLQNAYGKGLNG